MFRSVVFSCVFLVWCGYTATGEHCDCPNTSQMEFNITGRRNQTGHWNAQMLMGMEAQNKSIGPWAMNVGHKSTNCGDTETLLLNITLSMSPSTNETEDVELPYEHVPGLGYYKVYGSEGREYWKNWTEAKEICEQENANLLVINSKKEAESVGKVIENFGTQTYYHFIGFSDLNGSLVTIYNQTLREAGYVEFSYRVNFQADSCGMFHGEEGLIVSHCNSTAPFICERQE